MAPLADVRQALRLRSPLTTHQLGHVVAIPILVRGFPLGCPRNIGAIRYRFVRYSLVRYGRIKCSFRTPYMVLARPVSVPAETA
jgi:hypothetical protein